MRSEVLLEVEKKAERAESLRFCSGIKILHVRKQVMEILQNIGKMELFEEYTMHDMSHIDEMLKIVEWLIPEKTQEKMTAAEWLMLTLAIYFHDMGMVITKKEYQNRLQTEFLKYKKETLESAEKNQYRLFIEAQKDDKFLYQEYVRKNHAKRIKQWITEEQTVENQETIQTLVKSILSPLDKSFRNDLALICESHHLDDLEDFNKYKIDRLYGNDSEERVNLNYIAIILRIADLLHITNDRTPSITRKIINVSNPISVIEWEKQQAVRAIKPKSARNEAGDIDEKKEKDTIKVVAYFEGPEMAEAYFGLSSYLKYTESELIKCNEIVSKSQKSEGATYYSFPWKHIDETEIEVNGFETKKLQFTIAQENILELLVGHTLYNDSSVVSRELVQNAIDAIRLQSRIEHNQKYSGEVIVEYNEKDRYISVVDNGTGMTLEEIEKYLLKVGASKYRSEEIEKEFPDFCSISHFGIGILTCFMIADDVDIITNSTSSTQAIELSLRKVNGSYLLKNISKNEIDSRIREHGTILTVHARPDVNLSNIEKDLKKWIVVPDIPVYFIENNSVKKRIGYDSLKDLLKSYLSDRGYIVEGEEYDVREDKIGSVEIAYALKKTRFFSDWRLVEVDYDKPFFERDNLPIGICVEGIRVEFNSPGYKDDHILAIANIKNSKYQTNVARSELEINGNNQIVIDIYDIYKNYIQKEMDRLQKEMYSNSWAISESNFLMRPLVGISHGRNYYRPIDSDLLIERLSNIKCMAVEENGCRKYISAVDVRNMDTVTIIESKIIAAAETILKEVVCDKAVTSILESINDDGLILSDIKGSLISNYNQFNVLHEYALDNKEIVDLQVIRDSRTIRGEFQTEDNRWNRYRIRNGGKLFLFLPKEKFTISGLSEDEIGVQFKGNVYLDSNNEVTQYLLEIVKDFSDNEDEEAELLIEILFTSIFSEDLLQRGYSSDVSIKSVLQKHAYNTNRRINRTYIEKIINKIDPEKFGKMILKPRYLIYSIDNWTHHYEEME